MGSQKQYNIPDTALVLSAGFGKRLMPITKDIPKAMVEVDGVKVIDRAIKSLIDFGIKKIIVSTYYKADVLEKYLEGRYGQSQSVEILISHEDEILETGGGILNALNKFNLDELIVLNCDVVFDKGHVPVLEVLAQKWGEGGADFVAGLYPLNETDRTAGDFNIVGDKLSYIGDDKKYIFAGCYFLKKKIFSQAMVEKFSITRVLFDAENLPFTFKAVELKDIKWFDIGTPETLKIANEFFANEKSFYQKTN